MELQQVKKIMQFVFCEFSDQITEERIQVWNEILKDYSFDICFSASKNLISQKRAFAPKVGELIDEVNQINKHIYQISTWGEAWDKWVRLANKFGRYEIPKAVKNYAQECPEGFDAMGTAAKEWFDLKTEDVQIFKAQFRQRFESIHSKRKHFDALPPSQQKEIALRRADQILNPEKNAFRKVGDILKDMRIGAIQNKLN